MNKKSIIVIIALLLAGCIHKSQKITDRAVWHVSKQAINEILQCRSQGTAMMVCAENVIQKYGASKEAIAFTKSLDGRVFMDKFKDTGKVDVVRAVVLAADYAQGFYLVNGKPQIINIDDWQIISKVDKNAWFGNHNWPQIKQLATGGQAFIFNYRLKKCNACKPLGTIKISFNFDKNGKFLGAFKNSLILVD